MTKFSRYTLRTTDAQGARKFYAQLFGHDRAVIWPLHEQALARGAQPHWLGHIGVEDLKGIAAAFVARGAQQLGPAYEMGDGGQAVQLRDPGGALLGLATPPAADIEPGVDVVWHVLNTRDLTRAIANYHELFGWNLTERLDLAALGSFQQFAWHAGGPNVGAMGDIGQRSEVHAHWLFLFEVDALATTSAALRAAGGNALEPFVLPSGERICVCEDPQGATFGLRERRTEPI